MFDFFGFFCKNLFLRMENGVFFREGRLLKGGTNV